MKEGRVKLRILPVPLQEFHAHGEANPAAPLTTPLQFPSHDFDKGHRETVSLMAPTNAYGEGAVHAKKGPTKCFTLE